MKKMPDRTSKYQADSLSLIGAVALGTGVMIGAGIFALTGQMAQMTGGLIFGLSAAMMEEISFADGEVEQGNYPDYDALRLHQTPQIEVRILETQHHIGGVGEPATPPSMPALANAIYDLTGERIRNLPLNKRVRFIL